jgi:glycosyltransferase involved in cell wall biosynthesis
VQEIHVWSLKNETRFDNHRYVHILSIGLQRIFCNCPSPVTRNLSIMVSVVILTYQEEIAIADCLRSIEGFDDIHVLDSGSTDQTLDISRQFLCSVAENPFHSFAQQRNWALEHLPLKYDWVLFLDADERATPVFKDVLYRKVQQADDSTAGYYCCWKLMLENTWLRRSDLYPRWQFRLLHKKRACFTDFGHGQKENVHTGKIEYLQEPYLHYAFIKGWENWWKKHLYYAKHEAIERSKHQLRIKELFSSHTSEMNKALKTVLTRLPLWPFFRWFYPWVVRGGFLDGKGSFQYCWNISRFEKEVQSQLRLRLSGKKQEASRD